MEYKLENVPIVKIYKSTKNRDGEPYESAKGNPFTKVDIYIDPREIEHEEFEGKMTYFDYFENSANWDVGTQLTGTVTTNESRGKTYFNYNPPTSNKKSVPLDLKDLQIRVARLEGAVFGEEIEGNTPEVKEAIKFTKKALDKKEEDNLEDQLPF
jgi:hypothetical protein